LGAGPSSVAAPAGVEVGVVMVGLCASAAVLSSLRA
jgi:hypothetical protein